MRSQHGQSSLSIGQSAQLMTMGFYGHAKLLAQLRPQLFGYYLLEKMRIIRLS